ncbi:hypothetical protein JCGZ_05054 [Jatropha curcas]|uniref:GATA-type domain-containing protein n=2 Tax=Jatropha curcas TaxID=180498 RepID=A0A067KRY9_JATCU|nr:GATA transcription factor 26 isoform X2 [Jatropha curcas]KDP38897.1 hypothetical protein JCGZ_05054 [Jatropha curcas]
MGKQGPCHHCGTQSTPLWRNGPPEKPVLCNACGSRYRIRGSLANYVPKHAQGQPIAKRTRINSKEENIKIEEFSNDSYHSSTSSGDSTGTKSSSESAMSYPLCCCKIEAEDGGEIPGLIQESSWKSCIPSKKRSLVVHRNLSPIEKLQRDLRNILKYEKPSILSENEDDLLIYNANNLQVSCNEIGLGSTFLTPSTTSKELPIETHSSMDKLKKMGPAADMSMSLIDIKEELSP